MYSYIEENGIRRLSRHLRKRTAAYHPPLRCGGSFFQYIVCSSSHRQHQWRLVLFVPLPLISFSWFLLLSLWWFVGLYHHTREMRSTRPATGGCSTSSSSSSHTVRMKRWEKGKERHDDKKGRERKEIERFLTFFLSFYTSSSSISPQKRRPLELPLVSLSFWSSLRADASFRLYNAAWGCVRAPASRTLSFGPPHARIHDTPKIHAIFDFFFSRKKENFVLQMLHGTFYWISMHSFLQKSNNLFQSENGLLPTVFSDHDWFSLGSCDVWFIRPDAQCQKLFRSVFIIQRKVSRLIKLPNE